MKNAWQKFHFGFIQVALSDQEDGVLWSRPTPFPWYSLFFTLGTLHSGTICPIGKSITVTVGLWTCASSGSNTMDEEEIFKWILHKTLPVHVNWLKLRWTSVVICRLWTVTKTEIPLVRTTKEPSIVSRARSQGGFRLLTCHCFFQFDWLVSAMLL